MSRGAGLRLVDSDHAGYELKSHLVELLAEGGHEVVDVGTDSTDPVDYPVFCSEVGRQVRTLRWIPSTHTYT